MRISNQKIVINKETIDKITGELSKDNINKIRIGYLTGTIESDKIIVNGVYVPKQKSNTLSTTISSEEESRAFADIKSQRKSVIGFVQYNAFFPIYESNITRGISEQFAQTKEIYNLGLVVNQKGDYKTVIR